MAQDLAGLAHVRRKFRPHNVDAQVIILNTGALVGPEADAMLQALHSRSIGGFDSHFEVLIKRGAEHFMRTYYVGYGHKSIGDCGSTTIFIEGVSMLCAKAIQDWRLYSGQEASTRYIDFSTQPFVDPIGSETSSSLLKDHREEYLLALDELKDYLTNQYPRLEGEDEKKYEKNINARAFDISRSLLPAGASTNLAWHTNLRQAADHLALLRHHPLPEVRSVALAIEDALLEAYPNSFSSKRYEATEEYNERIMKSYYHEQDGLSNDVIITNIGISRVMIANYAPLLRNRPLWAELPRKIDECGMLTYEFALDFGSFRDIQRHRAVIQQMPLVTMSHGFEPWYLEQMPTQLATRVADELIGFKANLSSHDFGELPDVQRQYLIPMGYKLPNRITGGLHGITYLAERRARSDVHPTLQTRAHQIADDLRERFREFGMVVHTEDDPGRFSRKRSEQDIVMVN